RKMTDIVGIESDVAKKIAESLYVKLTADEQRALAVEPTNNSEAYVAYLHGLGFAQGGRFGPPLGDLLNAASFYERAVTLDPNFAAAWAQLSCTHAYLCLVGDHGAVFARRNAAKVALDNALRLAPKSTETLFALGYYQYWVLHDYEAAKSTFNRVIKMV